MKTLPVAALIDRLKRGPVDPAGLERELAQLVPTRCLPCPRRMKQDANGGGMVGPGHGYHLNGLRALKKERQKEHRLLMGRYARLERTGHPCLLAQGKMIDLNRRIIEMIDAEIADATK